MKNFLVIAFLLISAIVTAQPMSVQTDQNWGFVPLATYTWEIASDEILDMSDVLGVDNTGTYAPKGFKFRVTGGAVVLGPRGDVATGTDYIGEYVASGSVFPGWTGIRKPTSAEYNWVVAPVGSTVKVTFWMW